MKEKRDVDSMSKHLSERPWWWCLSCLWVLMGKMPRMGLIPDPMLQKWLKYWGKKN